MNKHNFIHWQLVGLYTHTYSHMYSHTYIYSLYNFEQLILWALMRAQATLRVSVIKLWLLVSLKLQIPIKHQIYNTKARTKISLCISNLDTGVLINHLLPDIRAYYIKLKILLSVCIAYA